MRAGPTYFDERNRASVQRQLVRRLERMGYKVALEPLPRDERRELFFTAGEPESWKGWRCEACGFGW